MGNFLNTPDLASTSLPVIYRGKSMLVKIQTNEQFVLLMRNLIGNDEVTLTPGKVITPNLRVSNVPDAWLIELI